MMIMKNMNGSSREGADIHYKEGAKLLDIESTDSDSQEHFSLPPLDLKGSRKKKAKMKAGSSSSPSGGGGGGCGCCSCCRSCGIFLLVVALLSTFVIGYFTYNLQLEVRMLKEKLTQVESLSQGNPGLHSTVEGINKNIKVLTATVSDQYTNISDIFKQIVELNKTAKDIRVSLQKAPYLLSLPGEVIEVKKQLVTMGSDLETVKSNSQALGEFQSFKDSVNEQLITVKQRLATLETKPKDDGDEQKATSRDLNSLQNDLSTLQHLINTVNFTLSVKLKIVNESTMLQQVQLRNTTAAMGSRLAQLETQPVPEASTRSIIIQEINKLNITPSGQIGSTALHDLNTRINTINGSLAFIRTRLPQMATLDSLANLTHRVDAMSIRLEEDINDLTKTVGLTTQHITDLQFRLSDYDTRLGKVEGAPVLTGKVAQRQDSNTGQQQGGNTGQRQGGNTGQQQDQGVNTGQQQGGNTGQQQGGNTGQQQGGNTGQQQGGNTGQQQGGNAGQQQGGNTGQQQGGNAGPQQGGNAGPQQGGNAGPQQGGNAGQQQGGKTGQQQGGKTGQQQGGNTGQQQGGNTGQQQGGNTGQQQGGNTGQQQGGNTGQLLGSSTGHLQEFTTGLKQGGGTGQQQGGHTSELKELPVRASTQQKQDRTPDDRRFNIGETEEGLSVVSRFLHSGREGALVTEVARAYGANRLSPAHSSRRRVPGHDSAKPPPTNTPDHPVTEVPPDDSFTQGFGESPLDDGETDDDLLGTDRHGSRRSTGKDEDDEAVMNLTKNLIKALTKSGQ